MMDDYEKNIIDFGKQLSEKNITGFNLEKLSGAHPDGIVIISMGGSGLAGEIIRSTKKEIGLNLPVIIWKDYGLPEHDFKRPFYIFASFSGNTEETLSGFENILKSGKKCIMAAVTTGGRLKKLAEIKNIPFVYFEAGHLPPRQSAGMMFYGLTKLLKSTGLNIKVKDYSDKIKPAKLKPKGKKLAALLNQRIVTIYTDEQERYLGYLWKIKINETAKTLAFNNVLPEMNHNEIVGFECNKFKTASIFLKSSSNPRTEKRFGLTQKLLKEKGVRVVELKFGRKAELEKAWETLILADWTSYFLGKANGISKEEFNIANPKIVASLKRLMR